MDQENRKMAEIILSGMHCTGCALNLTSAFKSLKGVIEADVDFNASKAQVFYDSSRLSQDDLVHVMEESGFEVLGQAKEEGIEKKQKKAIDDDLTDKRRRAIVGFSLGLPLMAGLGRAAEPGILIRTGDGLERAEKLDTIVFDKTGTLTKGTPEATDIVTSGCDEMEILEAAAALERNSSHPLAGAVIKKAEGLRPGKVENFRNLEGRGVEGMLSGTPILRD